MQKKMMVNIFTDKHEIHVP